MNETKTINVSTNTILRVIFIILLLGFLYLIKDVIILLIFALIIASAVAPAVNFLEKIKIPRAIGTLIIYVVTIGVIGFLISLIVPTFGRDVKDFASNLPNYIESLSAKFKSIQSASSRYGFIINKFQEFLSNIGDTLRQVSSNVLSLAIGVFGGVFSFLLILIMSFYISSQKRGVQRVLTAILPINYRDYVLNLWERAQKKLGRWLQGQLFMGLVVGTLIYVGLSVLNVRFALLLGVIAGVLEIFPYIGSFISGALAVTIGILQAPILGLWVLILYLVVYQIEAYILTPMVIGKVVGLNPIVVILALLIGAKLGGIFGMILAVPLSAVFAELLRDMIKKRKEAEAQ